MRGGCCLKMRGDADWRDPRGYDRLAGIDRAGVMWEWLRRDPDYIAWHVRASAATRGRDPRATADRWGLYFRRAADHRCARCDNHLGRGIRSHHATSRRRAGGGVRSRRRARSGRSLRLDDHRRRAGRPRACRFVGRLAAHPARRRCGKPRGRLAGRTALRYPRPGIGPDEGPAAAALPVSVSPSPLRTDIVRARPWHPKVDHVAAGI
uniref:transcriptional regulator domain-containing protein n=1 Tax=uncultured Sphingomonas sp. TaxID=158754 RepID=UPI0035CA7E30